MFIGSFWKVIHEKVTCSLTRLFDPAAPLLHTYSEQVTEGLMHKVAPGSTI